MQAAALRVGKERTSAQSKADDQPLFAVADEPGDDPGPGRGVGDRDAILVEEPPDAFEGAWGGDRSSPLAAEGREVGTFGGDGGGDQGEAAGGAGQERLAVALVIQERI
jgi:hypothetical protein